VPPPSSQKPPAKPSRLLALVCARIVAAYDHTWLAQPVAALAAPSGHRPERLSRLKTRLQPAFESLVDDATRRGRPRRPAASAETRRAPLVAALLTVAHGLLGELRLPIRRRSLQDRLVAAYDRLHAEHGATVEEFCRALALSTRTFRSWKNRPPRPAAPPPPPAPSPPRRNRRDTGRFALDKTAPGTQLGGDTTDLTVLGVDLKLVGVQDLGDREQRLFEAFDIDQHETATLVEKVVTEATADRQGLQLVTDQGTPYLADAARDAYDALRLDHAPQKEGTPTDKATVERAFGTLKNALAPLLSLTNRLADAVPSLRRPDLAKTLGTLLCAVFLRVYHAGRRHLVHPLVGQDPDFLRSIVEEQRDKAHAEQRSVRLFLEAVHAEYAMPGSREAFVRAFRRYPLEDLRDAERRFRARACRCVVGVCDRYFAAVVRSAHDDGVRRRAAVRASRRAAAEVRRARDQVLRHAAQLDAHPDQRLIEGLDILVATWLPSEHRFELDGAFARIVLRRALIDIARREPLPLDAIEAQLRAWQAAQPTTPKPLCDAVRAVIAELIPNIPSHKPTLDTDPPVGDTLVVSARGSTDNPRSPPPPALRI
jgi:hypothetical protein